EMDSSAQNAKVFLRIFPDTDAAKIFLHLHEIAPDVRFALGRRLALKSIPRLNFFLDVEEEVQT
ncbi:MAG: ribosome-binding factor A, partial [Candidatus Micrarchaeota archaeon]|nr:ribosome-binding factor A [Candidatus Micrarchaeota archaeon]